MKKLPLAGAVGMAVLCLSLQAVVPQKWELRTREDLLKGKLDGVSVGSDGVLALGPREERVAAPTEEFYLSVLLTADGTTYLGTGHGGKVYGIGKDGKAELYFQAPEMDVTALAQDKKGVLYAATSPNGKVYRVAEKMKGEVFFDPAERYIWDLEFMDNGLLWAAVGEVGGIYAVTPQGEGRMFFKAEENHILCLRRTAAGDVLAGSGGNGVVYRVSPEGRVTVVFETAYEEVRSLAVDKEGQIYAAASGAPSRPRKDDGAAAPGRAEPGPGTSVSVSVSAAVPVMSGASGAGAGEPASSPGGSPRESGALYRIAGDGTAKVLWSSAEEMVYTLHWKQDEQKVLFGTGNRGRIYSVDKDEKVSLLLQEDSEQVYLFAPVDSRLFVLSNNPCSLSRLLTEQRLAGEYVSPVLDARTVATWGRLSWEGSAEAGSTLLVQTRSGNTYEPNSTWTEWSPPTQKKEDQVLSPRARFLQAKVLFKTSAGRISPSLSRLTVFFLQSNIAPAVTRLELLKPNEVFLKLPDQEDVILGLEKAAADRPGKKDDLKILIPPKKAERKGFQTVAWEAADDNGDTLSYKLSMKKEGEAEWRVVQEGWAETIYTFDTLSYPDGTYFLKVTASDSPSNPAGLELRTERVSPPLVVDNSLPTVKNFTAVRTGAGLEVAFLAEDAYSRIEEVQFLVRPGEWRAVFPADGIADSRSEAFKFTAQLPAGAENLITVRVRDSYGNVGVYRQTF